MSSKPSRSKAVGTWIKTPSRTPATHDNLQTRTAVADDSHATIFNLLKTLEKPHLSAAEVASLSEGYTVLVESGAAPELRPLEFTICFL